MKRNDRASRKPPSTGSSGSPRSVSDTERLLDLLNKLLGSAFRQILWRRALELELTYSQSQVLFYVEQHPGCHMGDVARAFGVSLAAVTQVVDRLEQKRFMARGADPDDRRVSTLAVTPEGTELVAELRGLQRDGLEPVLAKISARDRARLVGGLQALVAAAAPIMEHESARPPRRAKPPKGRTT